MKIENIQPIPWMPYEAIDFLDDVLQDTNKVFEWGSGGSTLYFAEKTVTVVSVEHDKTWYDEMKKIVPAKVELIFISPRLGPKVENPLDPSEYSCTSLDYTEHRWEDYCKAIDKYGQFDLVSIDGRARMSCVSHARRHVHPGGHIIVDNMDTHGPNAGYDTTCRTLLADWQRTDFFGSGPYFEPNIKWRAAAFRKPI